MVIFNSKYLTVLVNTCDLHLTPPYALHIKSIIFQGEIMGTQQSMHKCKTCGKPTMFLGKSTSHLLHLILAIISVGFWIPVWIIISISNSFDGRCTICGGKKSFFSG